VPGKKKRQSGLITLSGVAVYYDSPSEQRGTRTEKSVWHIRRKSSQAERQNDLFEGETTCNEGEIYMSGKVKVANKIVVQLASLDLDEESGGLGEV